MKKIVSCLFVLCNCIVVQAQNFTSNLPIVIVTTQNNYYVSDDPKTLADIEIIHNPNNALNHYNDAREYVGKIGIEQRGSSSGTMPKKCYGFETWDIAGNAMDTNLLGMPDESDWILYASDNDKTFQRNVFTYDLFRSMGHYACRTRFCELFLYGQYQGIYILMEKIKRDKKRVNISKLDLDDNAGDSLTGGYIIKMDKSTGAGGQYFMSNYLTPAGTPYGFQYEYPNDVTITVPQQNYIKAYMDSFENALFGPNFMDAQLGYRKYINVNTFIDYFITNETSKNPDGYALSVYIYKPKDSNGKKLELVPWDYDLAWKNSYYLGADIATSGYSYDCSPYKSPWWGRFLQDSTFVNDLKCRWIWLRQHELSITRLHNRIDSIAMVLDSAQQRNFQVWPVLGQNVYYNSIPYLQTYQEEVDSLKAWITHRFTWLDSVLPGTCYNLATHELNANEEPEVGFYPNPSGIFSNLHIDHFPKGERAALQVYNPIGETVFSKEISSSFRLNTTDLAAGMYYYRVEFSSGISRSGKLVVEKQ